MLVCVALVSDACFGCTDRSTRHVLQLCDVIVVMIPAKVGDLFHFVYPDEPQYNKDLTVVKVLGDAPDDLVFFEDHTHSKQKHLQAVPRRSGSPYAGYLYNLRGVGCDHVSRGDCRTRPPPRPSGVRHQGLIHATSWTWSARNEIIPCFLCEDVFFPLAGALEATDAPVTCIECAGSPLRIEEIEEVLWPKMTYRP